MAQTVSSQGPKCCWGQQKKLDARVSQAEIAGIYNSLANVYDIWGNLTESKARNRALELAEIKNGQHILEVAVGTGLAFFEIVKRNPDGTNMGIDISAGMLKKAGKRLSRLSEAHYTLKKASAFDLDSEDAQFDVLINSYMFDLISFDRMDAVLKEFNRVLKKGGKLVLVNMTLGEKFGSGIYDRIYRVSPRLMGGCRGIRLSEKLKEHGFHIKLREYHQQCLFPSEVILAHK
ncbi:MAG: methyltransferase domain-containing protein [Desulfobacterales bacterium]|jgi:ubiquinone/menaquinone biosynthesis C-methylase UbiE|nr:methyltransferase domain-containing protein [Desulfobacterales bacterium]